MTDITKLQTAVIRWLKPPRSVKVAKVRKVDGVTIIESKDGPTAFIGPDTMRAIKETR